MDAWQDFAAQNIDILFQFQHLMFTCIHKHYSLDAWKDFAAQNKDILEVGTEEKVNWAFDDN